MTTNLSKKKIIGLSLLAVAVIAICTYIIGIIIALSMSDGTEKFQGQDKRIAQETLLELQYRDDHRDGLDKFFDPLDWQPQFKTRVEAVFKLEPGTFPLGKSAKTFMALL